MLQRTFPNISGRTGHNFVEQTRRDAILVVWWLCVRGHLKGNNERKKSLITKIVWQNKDWKKLRIENENPITVFSLNKRRPRLSAAPGVENERNKWESDYRIYSNKCRPRISAAYSSIEMRGESFRNMIRIVCCVSKSACGRLLLLYAQTKMKCILR